MTESKLTSKLKKALEASLPSSVIIKHCDSITAGVPDMSVTWNGRTTWLEVKHVHAAESVRGKGIQALMMSRLAAAGSAVYVIFSSGLKRTFVVLPHQLDSYVTLGLSGDGCPNSKVVADYIRGKHP